MSILVKGMEMPDRCGRCRFANAFDCTVTGNFISTHSIRQPDCPLVPVPLHGRLIDADALVERIEGIWDCNDMVFRPNDKICKIPEDCKGCKWAQTKDCIQRMVENATTIIPAEESE